MTKHEEFLQWRNIPVDQACTRCQGSGGTTYGSTATWRGGIGGQAMTYDVCNLCWGSGWNNRPWTNLKRVQAMQRTLRTLEGYAP
jgi:hypothetical protein